MAVITKFVKKCPSCGHAGMYNSGSYHKCYNCCENLTINPDWVEPAISLPPPAATTQKAKGVQALSGQNFGLSLMPLPMVWLQLATNDAWPDFIKQRFEPINGLSVRPLFARPCPPSPEHGFVESRVVSTLAELEQVRTETLAANEASEVMLMEPINADLNAVWTPHLITIGPGHDGATSGKDALSLPLAGTNPLSQALLEKALITDGKDPYIEAVRDASHWSLTQLRSGPKLESGVHTDFIPKKMKVQEIIRTNGEDLLAWAKIVRGLKGKKGTVVWHPGGSLTDHYSVHCRENGVPILISREPSEGETLAPLPVPPLDPQAILEGIAAVDRMNPYKVGDTPMSGDMTLLSLVALHHSAALRGKHSFWIGAGAAILLKLGCSALEAEARHAHNCYAGMKQKPDIYNFYSGKTISFLRARLSRITQLLHYGWGETGEIGKTGYGGIRWAWCGAAMCPLFNAIRDLAREPSEENASNLVLALNIAVNQAHNGGWWLNKFCNVSAYTDAPKGALYVALGAAIAARAVDQARATMNLERTLKAITAWPETEIKPLQFRSVDLEIGPGSVIMNLKPSIMPQKRQIVIPANTAFVKQLLKSAEACVEIKPGRIDLLTNKNDRVNIWAEKPLEIVARDANKRQEVV